MTKIFNFVVKLLNVDIFITFFFLFSVAPFLSFFNFIFIFQGLDFFDFFKFFIIIYIFLFFFFIFVLDVRVLFFSKKNELNQVYVKYMYIFYTYTANGFSFAGICLNFFVFFYNIYIKNFILNIFFFLNYVSNLFFSYFIFWKPITKRISYFGLFRVSRTKWIHNTTEEFNRFKY